MVMQYKYDKESDIPAAVKSEYKERNGVWFLDVEGGVDTAALQRSVDHEKEARKAAEKKVKDLQAEKDAAEFEKAKATGDLAVVNAAWEKRINDIEAERKEEKKAAERQLKQTAIKEAASKLAGEISTVPALMQRAIADRLTADVVDGVAIVRVLDAHGKATAASITDLRTELVASPDYAAIIVKSKASGGSATQATGQGGTPGSAGAKRLAEMTEVERRAYFATDPEGFKRERDAEKAKAA